MSTISERLVRADRIADYIPVVSTATNLIDLFQKCLVLPCVSRKCIARNHYYKYLNQKSLSRCVVVSIPILGNIIACLNDSLEDEKKEAKTSRSASRMGDGGYSGGGGGGATSPLYSYEERYGCGGEYGGGYGGTGSVSIDQGQCHMPKNPFDLYTQCPAE